MTFVENVTAGFQKVSGAAKIVRVMVTGSSTGTLDSLATANKTSIIGAINEVFAKAPNAATESAAGIVRFASLSEMATGVATDRVATVAGVRQERAAVKAEILGGVGDAYDTLIELRNVQVTDENALTQLAATKANKTDVYNKDDIGDVTTNFVNVVNTALA